MRRRLLCRLRRWTGCSAVADPMELARWVLSLSDVQRKNMMVYLCGWKPEIMATLLEAFQQQAEDLIEHLKERQ
jgi:hypothetical protein